MTPLDCYTCTLRLIVTDTLVDPGVQLLTRLQNEIIIRCLQNKDPNVTNIPNDPYLIHTLSVISALNASEERRFP